jgi:hypothetical protein
MPTSLAFDHLIYIVPDLPSAMEAFTRLGFTVTSGGIHGGGVTHNALVPFIDGTYLELMAPTQPRTMALWRRMRMLRMLPGYLASQEPEVRPYIFRVAFGPGPVDYALSVGVLPELIETVRERGLPIEGPLNGGRVRPDGERLEWQMAFPQTLDLPFVIADLTPHSSRVPAGDARRHANDALGAVGLEILVRDLQTTSSRYELLFGAGPLPSEDVHSPSEASLTYNLSGMLLHLTPAKVPAFINGLGGLPARPHSLLLQTSTGRLRLSHQRGQPILEPLSEEQTARYIL